MTSDIAPDGAAAPVPGGAGAPAATATMTPAAPAAPGAAAPVATEPGGAPGTGRSEGGLARPLDLLHGVEMAVTVELGRTRVLMRDLLGLRAGSIVELDRPAGGPVDVVVNGTLLARGEVVVVDDELGVRITEVVGTAEDS